MMRLVGMMSHAGQSAITGKFVECNSIGSTHGLTFWGGYSLKKLKWRNGLKVRIIDLPYLQSFVATLKFTTPLESQES